jgi:hypothetical protein
VCSLLAGWEIEWKMRSRVLDVLHRTGRGGLLLPLFFLIHVSNILFLLSKYLCLEEAANALI